jgi:hypothetical protein
MAEGLDRRVVVGLTDDRAVARAGQEEPAAGEVGDRLADAAPADAEPLHQLALGR